MGENMSPDGRTALLDDREDGVTPIYDSLWVVQQWKKVNKFGNLDLSLVFITGCCFSSTHPDQGDGADVTQSSLFYFDLDFFEMECRGNGVSQAPSLVEKQYSHNLENGSACTESQFVI